MKRPNSIEKLPRAIGDENIYFACVLDPRGCGALGPGLDE
jgi:predicted RNase H-like HicB family nuclease